MQTTAIQIDIFSDPICPWCFIGRRRLSQALQARLDIKATTFWRPFQLNPDMPELGMDRNTYLLAKFGDTHRASKQQSDIIRTGEIVGIHFAFDKIKRTPNTLPAHLLIQFAQKNLQTEADFDRRDALIDALFTGYFIEGRDIGDITELVEIGAMVGFNKRDIKKYLEDGRDVQEILAEDLQARHIGVSGVPCFIFNGSFALMGAQEPEAFNPLFDALILQTT